MPVSLVVGLGNPGREYAETRHNAGFRAVSAWASKLGVAFSADAARKGEFAKAVFNGAPLWLAKPTTYMNNSGECVSAFARYRKIDFSEVAVVYDDITLPPGTLKFSLGGGDGGHNGMKNIIYHMKSDTIPRIKVGVGAKPAPEYDLADWVLSRFSKDEAEKIKAAAEKTATALEFMVEGDIDSAMSKVNS